MTNFKPDATIMTLDQLTAIADQASKRGLKTTIHHTSAASFRRAIEAGISSLAHMAGDERLTEDDIALFLSSDCIVEPTMSVPYDMSYQIAGDPTFDDPNIVLLSQFRERIHEKIVDRYWIPEFQAAARGYHHKVSNGKMTLFGFLPMKKMYVNFAAYCTAAVQNLRLLFENGATMTTSNDGGIPPCTLAMLQHEVDLLHLFLNQSTNKDLFKGADALRMATINSAKCLGLEDDFGTIETGKVADLVIIDGDPLEDLRLVGSRVAALFIDGRLVVNNCGLQVANSEV
jgi:imidazolonepropionase-like amidohydrolase